MALQDFRSVISEEALQKILDDMRDDYNKGVDMHKVFFDEHMSVPEMAYVVDHVMGLLAQHAQQSLIATVLNNDVIGDEEADFIANGIEVRLIYTFLAGYFRGLRNTPLTQLKGLCGHDHSGN